VLLARIMAGAGNRRDLRLRQNLSQFVLSCCRHNVASASDDVNDRRLDLAHEAPEFGRHKTVTDRGISLPNNAAIRTFPGPVAHICSKNVFTCSWAAVLLLREKLFLRCPAFFVLLLEPSGHPIRDFARTFRADVL